MNQLQSLLDLQAINLRNKFIEVVSSREDTQKGSVSIEAAFVFGSLIAIAVIVVAKLNDRADDAVAEIPDSLN